MKILPCAKCGQARLGSGELYYIQRYPGATYQCHQCHRTHHLTPEDFRRLPPATRAEMERGGALESLAQEIAPGQKPTKEDVEAAKEQVLAPPGKVRSIDRRNREE